MMTPNVGAKGKFTIKEPFNDDDFFNGEVEVVYIATFASVIDSGKEPYTEYYEPVGLSLCEYKCDIPLKANIVRFKNSEDEYRDIPDTYIESIPVSGGYEYVPVSLIVQLPPTWINTAYDHLLASFNEVTARTLGVRPVVTEVAVTGKAVWLDTAGHELELADREMVKDNIHNNVFAELAHYKKENELLTARLNILEKKIKGEIDIASNGSELFKSVVDGIIYGE